MKRTLVGDPKTLTAALALLLVAGLGAREASAEARAFVIDPAASQIRFFATSRFVDAEGRFRRFEGTIRIDETRPETASGTLVVELGSARRRRTTSSASSSSASGTSGRSRTRSCTPSRHGSRRRDC